jgi:diguanylate cyclase
MTPPAATMPPSIKHSQTTMSDTDSRTRVLSNIVSRLRDAFLSPPRVIKTLTFVIIVLGLLGGAWLVHVSGGAQFATLHVMYLPTILAALVFGAGGGIATGVVAGLLLGPYMLLDTASGETQQLGNWLLRIVFFCMIGGVVGVGAGTLRRQLKMLAWLNEHDAGTGFLNNVGLARTQRLAIEREGAQARVLLIVVQIKNLPFGARFSEQLLKKVYERGRALIPADVPIALIQSDRLAVVFNNRTDTLQLRSEIEARVRSPYQIDGVPVYVDFAFGGAEFPQQARTFEELFQKASIAAHTAVTRQQLFHTYDSAADLTSRENLELLGMIPAALANNEFALWHQAKLALATEEISGTEALIRWGFIPPGTFIPRAEESPLINDITRWVIGTALADKAAWTARGHSLRVAINLSVRNLHQRSLHDTLHETVSMHRIEPQEVELEITESAVMGDMDYCVALIKRLRDRGYRVSIDDFGTGYSSLAYLKKLPISALKIDRAFVRDLSHDASDQKIVRTILDLARSLHLETVAEGVEDEKSLALLREWRCDYAQGFAVHRPSPPGQLVEWIERNLITPAG